ncbi:translocation protein SEC62-like isoform X2 [Mya arenaria]|uniref:translocation protein SEC62-like isoform X2 n=1 Tax=Mya arenaria TaxID=6604 RepID=UPI0022DF24D9|nr:translocation protein SEC62-like isoform X2 [Mya arenaria]
MADRRKTKRKSDKEEQACTKEEYAVAKYLRFNCPAHTGKLAGMTVKCFIASQAIECLMDSKWAKGKANPDSEIVFTDRKSISQFLNRYIQKGLFHRADKMESKSQKERKRKKKEEEEKAKKAKKKTDKTEKTEKVDADNEKDEEKKTEKKKNEVKLKKFKLNMSEDQRFVDGNSIYVWIYDPIHPKTFFIGFLMLLGAVALCLFPLWPDWMRIAVYYASLLGASFVGLMLVLIVLRVIVFSIVWVLTLGKHHLWIFPNLTEDVGVLDSFKPLYKHDVYPPPEIEKELEDDKKKKDEDAEAEDSENGDDKNEDFEMINDKNGDSNADDRTGEESGEGEEN